ncbi:probable citrate lyase subunit beta (Citrate (pro-3S)-lyase subunit beta) [Rhynchosporium secalis]|uniref:Probable citrate lyase subunit beta (Citrate (Pro-3S)-lyase subunit beta) n=1 Tax=Rhynchosporium secalis TaxID=38038 RepID=A0A1E1MEB8_RHYSE|nr:probable citrate lyase subunit beta (Citrate (pro-3S)-lyase subunit beta) [Rhynchosporium secalis]
MSTSSILRRALLYVPASSPKFLQKSLSLPPLDTVSYDLEDSVTPSQKPEARKSLLNFLSQPSRPSNINELSVRINAVATGLALDDLTTILRAKHLDAIVLPKVNKASDLHFVTDVLRHQLPERQNGKAGTIPVKIIALIESAEAIMNLGEICKASPYLSGLVFAAEDFALDLSLTRTPSLTEFLYARSAIVTAARAFSLPSTIDLVCTSFRGPSGSKTLEEECVQGRGLGFNGKQCIHPSQVEAVQRAFAPGKREVEWAVRVVVADEKADRSGRGAWTLDGKMIDVPVVGKARSVVRRAERCGFDVGELKEKWKGQEPE